MSIDWKRPEGPFIIALQEFFFDRGYASDWKGLETGNHPSPHKNYVYTSENEIARAIGIEFEKLDEDQIASGPLTHVFQMSIEAEAEELKTAIPPESVLQMEFFATYVDGQEGTFCFCDDSVLDYVPDLD